MLVVKINRLTIVWFKARSPFVLKHTTSYYYYYYYNYYYYYYYCYYLAIVPTLLSFYFNCYFSIIIVVIEFVVVVVVVVVVSMHLKPLRRQVETMEECEFPELEKRIPALYHIICLIWANSTHYQHPSKIVVLMQELSNFMIEIVRH